MTMIDEDLLRRALVEAGSEFADSHDAVASILEHAKREEETPRVRLVPAIIRTPGRPRTLLLAAAVLVIVTSISAPLIRSETHAPASESALGRASSHGVTGLTVKGPSSVKKTSLTASGSGFAAPSVPSSANQKIESTGSVSLTVSRGKVESTFTRLSVLATNLRGLTESTSANSTQTSRSFASGTIVLEVPEKSFTLLVDEVERVGRAMSVTTTSQNVTLQYSDLQAKITALNASLGQYLKIMTKATTISGILAVQDQITTIQSEIGQAQSQLRVLANETTYASLAVNVSDVAREHVSVTRTGFAKAWHDSLNGFVVGFEWLVRLAGPALFALLLIGALYEIIKYGWRAIRRRRI